MAEFSHLFLFLKDQLCFKLKSLVWFCTQCSFHPEGSSWQHIKLFFIASTVLIIRNVIFQEGNEHFVVLYEMVILKESTFFHLWWQNKYCIFLLLFFYFLQQILKNSDWGNNEKLKLVPFWTFTVFSLNLTRVNVFVISTAIQFGRAEKWPSKTIILKRHLKYRHKASVKCIVPAMNN